MFVIEEFMNAFGISTPIFNYILSYCGGFQITSNRNYLKFFLRIYPSNQIIQYNPNATIILKCNTYNLTPQSKRNQPTF